MAQTGYTPISIYYSSTATNVPTAGNLVAGELAINTADGKLFYKDSAGVVQTIASKAGNVNVSSFSGGTTGLTPNTATTGVVTLAGTLAVANGGTGVTTSTGSGSTVLSTSPTLSGTAVIPTINAGAATALTLQSAGTTAVTIDTSQNVGIGTSSPDAKFKVVASGANLLIGYSGTANYYDASTHTFRNFAGTNYLNIDSSGNVLVGCTSAPASNRTKGFEAKNNSSGGIQVYQTVSNSDWAVSTTSGSICNFYSDNGSALVYAGNISVNGNITTYNSISDYRLKENVAPLTGALEKVSQLNPVTYTFKDGGQKSEGFIAHELQAIIPEAVTGIKDAVKTEFYEISPAVPAVLDEEGKEVTPAIEAVMGQREVPDYQGVDTSFLIATMTAAIQELNAKVDAQATTIAELQAKVG